MSDFSKMTCKTRITIMSGGYENFSEKMHRILNTSGSIESPVLTKDWPILGEVSLLSYTGIIVIQTGVLEKYSEEDLSYAVSGILYNMTYGIESPLLTQNILLCRELSDELITTFCDLHNLSRDNLIKFDSEICYWSISVENNNFLPQFKPSKKHVFFQ